MGFPRELKTSGELYDNISYLLELGGVVKKFSSSDTLGSISEKNRQVYDI